MWKNVSVDKLVYGTKEVYSVHCTACYVEHKQRQKNIELNLCTKCLYSWVKGEWYVWCVCVAYSQQK